MSDQDRLELLVTQLNMLLEACISNEITVKAGGPYFSLHYIEDLLFSESYKNVRR